MHEKRTMQQKAILMALYAARMIKMWRGIDRHLFDGMIDIFCLIKEE